MFRRFLKGNLLASKRWSFTMQKATFYTVKGGLSDCNLYMFSITVASKHVFSILPQRGKQFVVLAFCPDCYPQTVVAQAYIGAVSYNDALAD